MKLDQMEGIAKTLGVPVRWWNARRVNRRWGRGMITNWSPGRDRNLIAGIEVFDPMPDIRELSHLIQGERTMKRRLHDVWLGGGPTAISGGLAGLIANPPTVNQTTITGSATEQALIPTALLPIEQNVQSGKIYHLFAGGTSTTAATPGTYTLATRLGSAGLAVITSPLLTAVSSAFTPLASMTAAPWNLFGPIVIRGSGTANTAAGTFSWSQTSVASTAISGPSSVSSAGSLGGVSASFDTTAAAGSSLWIGVTHATSTTNTWIPQLVVWGSWN
jgi:hypothetical protein